MDGTFEMSGVSVTMMILVALIGAVLQGAVIAVAVFVALRMSARRDRKAVGSER